MSDPVKLITNKTDQDYANELRARVVEAYKPLIVVLQEAIDNKFIVNATVGQSQVTGKVELVQLQLMKGF